MKVKLKHSTRTVFSFVKFSSQFNSQFYNLQFNRDARLVAFRKSGSLGIQVSGGNKSGIFVAAVKEGSPAYNEGLRKGDQVLMVRQSNHDSDQISTSQ